jgi:hypothetical protein
MSAIPGSQWDWVGSGILTLFKKVLTFIRNIAKLSTRTENLLESLLL